MLPAIMARLALWGVILWAALTWTSAASTLIFPRIGFEAETYTGIAIVNPTGTIAQLEITAFGSDGKLLTGPGFVNPRKDFQVPAYSQAAVVAEQIFGSRLPATCPETRNCFGWIRVVSPTTGLAGFFLHLNQGITQFDGADLPSPSRKLVFPRLRDGGGFATELNLVNPGGTDANNVSLSLFLPGEAGPRTAPLPDPIPALGMLRFRIADIFPGLTTVPDRAYLVVTANTALVGFEIMRPGVRDFIGLNAVAADSGNNVLYFPQVAVLGPWSTYLGVLNLSQSPVLASVSIRKADGSLFSGAALQGTNPAVVQIPAGGSIFREVAGLFRMVGQETVDGWLQVETEEPVLTGFVTYGVTDTKSLAAVGTQTDALTQAFFGHIATSLGYFTGMALLNPGKLATNFRVMAFSRDDRGTRLLGTYNGLLQPGQRISKLIQELIPEADGRDNGFIWIRSDFPLYMTSLFGTAKILANVPPQPAPIAYRPDLNPPQPTLQVNPPLAVVQPGKTQQFTASGVAGAPKWRVDGISGGNTVVGRVSSAGVYSAPAGRPDPLPVTISAEVGATVGGASIDVLTKESVASGLGVVQSIAYLERAAALYSSELLSGTAGMPGVGYRAGETSGIFFIGPGPRKAVTSLAGNNIVKMVPYLASDNREYLLLCARTPGRILRLDPLAPGAIKEIFVGLDRPSSMVLDPVTGDLLVAEANQIRTISRTALESGITSSAAEERQISSGLPPDPRDRERFLIPGFKDTRGIAVDSCTGDVYVSFGRQVVGVSRFTGQSRTVSTHLTQPGQLLGLHRSGVPCPVSFQLLATDTAAKRIGLIAPAQNTTTFWAEDTSTRDLAYLPSGNPINRDTGVLLGEVRTTSSSQVSVVRVPGLYNADPVNLRLPPVPGSHHDPAGDTVGEEEVQIDITEVTAYQTSEGVTIIVRFAEPVRPPGEKAPNSVVGFIDLDLDQNPATGYTSAIDYYTGVTSGLGLEGAVSMWEHSPATNSVPIYGTGDVSIAGGTMVFLQDGHTVRFNLNLRQLNPDGLLNFAIIVGTWAEPTDIAPNGGFLSPAAFSP